MMMTMYCICRALSTGAGRMVVKLTLIDGLHGVPKRHLCLPALRTRWKCPGALGPRRRRRATGTSVQGPRGYACGLSTSVCRAVAPSAAGQPEAPFQGKGVFVCVFPRRGRSGLAEARERARLPVPLFTYLRGVDGGDPDSVSAARSAASSAGVGVIVVVWLVLR